LATAVTGLKHIDLDACSKRGIHVASLKNETEFLKEVRATAELAVALTLALLRHIPDAVASVKVGRWDRDAFRGRELYGKTVGIVGVGRLGKLVAGYFKAFGCNVLGYDPLASFAGTIAQRTSSLPELLRSSDIVTIHVDYNPSTRNLIGRSELALMRTDAILVNTSRGGVVDEEALLESLTSGAIGGAALDVLECEPDVDNGHPLIAFSIRSPRLLIVPHIGGSTEESLAKTEVFLAHKVVRELRKLA
jgi:D-3-phosphoglycerate dehydrogenase